ncbi:MAG: hypothetical protein V4736_04600, partial [Bdellovibrionota bacterium]
MQAQAQSQGSDGLTSDTILNSNSSFSVSNMPAQQNYEATVPVHNGLHSLDSESQEMIREVKRSLNLSSETEALRAVIKLGTMQVRNLTGK